jgi:hypothetical protein
VNIQDLQAEIIAIDQEAAHVESVVEQSNVKKLLNIIERLAGKNDTQKSNLHNLSDEISGESLFLSKDFPCSQHGNSQKYRDQLDCYASSSRPVHSLTTQQGVVHMLSNDST